MDLEVLFAEAPLGRPSDEDPDYSELNGYANAGTVVSFYRNGHRYDPVADAQAVRARGTQGFPPAAGAEDRGPGDPVRRPRSLSSAAVEPHYPRLAEVPVARLRWLTDMIKAAIRAAAPNRRTKLLWAIGLGLTALWILGVVGH